MPEGSLPEWLQTLLGSGGAALPAVFAIGAVALATAIYELFVGSKRAVIPPASRMHIFEHLKNERKQEALSRAQSKKSPFTNIVKTALRLPEDTPSYITYATIEDTLFREVASLRARVILLQGLGLLSLLAGLAGTLGGLYKSLSGGGIQTAATLAKSVTGVLPAVVAGVVICIVILAAAFFFQMRLSVTEAALSGDASRLAAYILGRKYIEAAIPEAKPTEAGTEEETETGEAPKAGEEGEESASE
ncbi:MAG: MotA/TolQ/ExbB proton channel family protein [Planctomycetes bacterium]|nr:MotA/TolQ/ExbB proton channel family protein [Planctomycetota bacterium]